jgi:tetratricopeptide (TPR) repeat protein
MKKYKELLYKKHNMFDRADTDEQRLLLRYEISAIIEDTSKPDAQDFHILGLVYYDTAQDEHDIRKAHDFFKQSLNVDNKYNMARLYSAHCYHDLDEYSDALKEYLLVNSIELINNFAFWRYAKLQEQIGFCYHKLGDVGKAKKYFKVLLGFYEREIFETVGYPSEVYDCLDENDEIYRKIKEFDES